MREICFIIPEWNSDGIPRPDVHDLFRDACITWAGEVTITRGHGAWRNPQGEVITEPVAVYTVAIEETLDLPHPALTGAALYAGRQLNQECIYRRDAQGTVHLLKC
jgi:hypothetical protein